MSGWQNKQEVVSLVRSTILTDWNKTNLSRDYRDYNMTKLVAENFYYLPNYGWYARTSPDEFIESLHRNLKRKKVSS